MTFLTGGECFSRRKALGLTQVALARLAGLTSLNYVGRFEANEFAEPSVVKVSKIQAALSKAEATKKTNVTHSQTENSQRGAVS